MFDISSDEQYSLSHYMTYELQILLLSKYTQTQNLTLYLFFGKYDGINRRDFSGI
jgi:hypothetical protein